MSEAGDDIGLLARKLYKLIFQIFNFLANYISTILAPRIDFQLHSETAIIPKKGTRYSAGYDLYSDMDVTLSPLKRCKIETNVSVNMYNNTTIYGRIAERSGLALKSGLKLGGGVIDADYHGTIGVIAFNLSDSEISFKKGDRVAQLIFEKTTSVIMPNEEPIYNERGTSGFGSTDKPVEPEKE